MILIHPGLSGQDNSRLITKDTTIAVRPATKPGQKPERRWGDGGTGVGIDYGGLIGAKVTFYPIPDMGVFAAGGYELVGLGWNVGCLGRIIPADGRHGARPYLKVMYGVNGVTKVTGKSGINFDLNIPFRSPDFFDQISQMKNDPQI